MSNYLTSEFNTVNAVSCYTLWVGGYRSAGPWSPRIMDSCSYCGWM